jgi:hypothetical protein
VWRRDGSLGVERYVNLDGDSGVRAYEVGVDSIAVEFVDGRVYLYTYGSAGSSNVEQMKVLARSGRGLSTFISRYAKDRYESKRR